MSQIVLPLSHAAAGPARIVLGAANAPIAEALAHPESWPFRTAVLSGPPRSGKSLFARWFAESGNGDAIAAAYLGPRAERSDLQLEKLVEAIDRLSLERKVPPTLAIWRAALEAVHGPEEPRLL